MPSYKDNNGTWYCKFYYKDEKGNRKAKLKRGFKLKREADEWERAFLQVERLPSCDMPFTAFISRYIADISPTRRQHTMQTKKYRYKRFAAYFGDTPLNDITPLAIREYINKLLGEDLSDKYVKSLMRELSILFNHAVRFYELRSNPCHNLGTIKNPNQQSKEMRFYTFDEFNALISYVTDDKARLALNLLYYTGMRKGELLALKWDDIDNEHGTIRVDESLQKLNGANVVITPTKTGEMRIIAIPKWLINDINAYHNKELSPFIFTWEKRFIEKAIENGARLANIKRIHVHGFRHSHASYLISKGVNIVLISKRLGHAKTSITLDTYSHFFPTDEQELVKMLEKDKQ